MTASALRLFAQSDPRLAQLLVLGLEAAHVGGEGWPRTAAGFLLQGTEDAPAWPDLSQGQPEFVRHGPAAAAPANDRRGWSGEMRRLCAPAIRLLQVPCRAPLCVTPLSPACSQA